jgi:PleD family two-component response regulator
MVLEDAGDVRLIADDIVTVIRDTPFSFEGMHIPMTVSLGASLAGAEPGTVVFERADAALYAAKTSGRDQAKIG